MAVEGELRIEEDLVATPGAWEGVDEALKQVVKIPVREKSIASTQLVVGDLQGVTARNLSFETIPGDLRIIERAVVENPDKVRRLLDMYSASGGDPELIDFRDVEDLLVDLNFSEVSSSKAGGGMLPLLILAIVICGSCAHCDYARRD